MAVVVVAKDLHFKYLNPTSHEHLPSYECLTTWFINLTIGGTFLVINNHFRSQVNKDTTNGHFPRRMVDGKRKSTVCPSYLTS